VEHGQRPDVVDPVSTKSAMTPSFDQAVFETAIRETMKMGMPETEAACLHWYWARLKTFAVPDSTGIPYDFNDSPTSNQPGNPVLPEALGPGATPGPVDQSLVVPYALEFSSRPAGTVQTVLGEIDQSRAVVTLLHAEFLQVQTADYCILDDARYSIQFMAPTFGLFGSMVHQAYLQAEDEH